MAKDQGQVGTIKQAFGSNAGDKMDVGDTKALPISKGLNVNDGPGTIRNPPRAPSPDTQGSANRPSTGKLRL